MNKNITKQVFADILGTSKRVVDSWEKNGRIKTVKDKKSALKFVSQESLKSFSQLDFLFSDMSDEFYQVRPNRPFKIIELFAGCGGLALGLEQAGFQNVLVNEIDTDAANTLKKNRPNWNVINDDVANVDFKNFRDQIDMISGGFPCQAFSYAGKKLGFDDTRGTLFYQFARAVKEVNPKVFVAENVKGLSSHDNGRTLKTITYVIEELGYKLVASEVLKAIFYRVPQKRERLILVAIRKDLANLVDYFDPPKFSEIFTLKDALKNGRLYNSEAPKSDGQAYPKRKKEIMSKVPAGGYWRDLPDDLQREYMKGSYFLGGGKTGVARRLSWHEPSLTLTCAPAQKQTERCHPEETRPLTVGVCQIKPFQIPGVLWLTTSQYKQIEMQCR